jgi:2-octaprenyl-3-methyl-6-methoxy-1,4-benzoquinol hydroxylase
VKALDIIVVGGGMVGLSAALMAARQGLQVALVEAHAPKPWQKEQPDQRVVALALDNQALIDSFGLWQDVLDRRAYPYSTMTVFDAVHSTPLRFDAGELGRPYLGHILENDALVEVLWQAVIRESNILLYCPDKIGSLHETESEVRIGLQSGVELSARLAIGADGASTTWGGRCQAVTVGVVGQIGAHVTAQCQSVTFRIEQLDGNVDCISTLGSNGHFG